MRAEELGLRHDVTMHRFFQRGFAGPSEVSSPRADRDRDEL
jgi:hypothetical protein